jgi:hypothetical protein
MGSSCGIKEKNKKKSFSGGSLLNEYRGNTGCTMMAYHWKDISWTTGQRPLNHDDFIIIT